MADRTFDFFISYTASDELWAEWIAWELEAANYSVIIQKWDMRPGANFVLEMHRAARTADRTIAVLSPAYFESNYADAEWAAAVSDDRNGELGKLVPVRVAECAPPGLLRAIVRIDVFGKSEDLARRMLLEGVNPSRAKPTDSPRFPGGSTASGAAPKSPPFPGDLPKFWTVPFRSNPYFQGRDSDLKCLFDAIGRTGAVVVHGLGGIGKTQLATQYAYSRADDYQAVLWISADKPGNLSANIAALASPSALGLAEHVEKEQEPQFEAVVGWLRNNRRWLLVLDGADTEAAWKAAVDLIEMLPAGHVIVTSRLSAKPPTTIADHAVEKLSEPAAVKILIERTQRDGQALGDKQEALAIVRELDGLPLALEQASAYLTHEGVSFKGYLAGLKTTLADVLKRQTPGATRYPHSVFATWLVSKKELSAEAKAVLKLCSCLAPEPIPRKLFSSDEQTLLAAVRQIEPACTTADIDAGLRQLADFSLVKLRADTVTCHPLLMFVQREGLDESDRRAWLSLALRLVDKAAPTESDDVRTWPVWNGLRPHVVALVTNSEAHVVDGPAARLANDLTLMLLVKAEFEAAEPLLKRAREIAAARHGQDHPTFARSLGNEGVRLWQTGRVDEAEPLLRRAHAIDERCLSAEQPELAIGLHVLGRFLCETDRKQEGEPHLARALAIHETHYGLNHPKVAESCVALTTALLNTPRSAEAEPLLRRALAIFEKERNAKNPNVADVCNNLAVWLREEKRGPEAEALLRRALSIEERNYGADNPRLARMLMNLAVVLDEDHKYSEADSFRERAFASLQPNATTSCSQSAPDLVRSTAYVRKFSRGASPTTAPAKASLCFRKNARHSPS
jgi:tetratricopeptide (TPR) repeat protein